MTDAEKLALIRATAPAESSYEAVFAPAVGELVLARRRWGEGPGETAVDVFLIRKTPDSGEAHCLATAVDPVPPVARVAAVEDAGTDHWLIASTIAGPEPMMLPIATDLATVAQIAMAVHHCSFDELEVED